MSNKNDKRSLPQISKNTSTEKVRRSKIKKSHNNESENEENIREHIEMPSIKRISNKKRIKSPTSTTRRQLFKTETMESIVDTTLSTQQDDIINESIQSNNSINKTNKTKSKKKKFTEDNKSSNNNEAGDHGIKTISDKDTKVKRKRKSKSTKVNISYIYIFTIYSYNDQCKCE